MLPFGLVSAEKLDARLRDGVPAPVPIPASVFAPNPAFTPYSLTPADQARYAYVWQALTANTVYPNPEGALARVNADNWQPGGAPFDTRAGLFYYTAGRVLGKHYYALLLLYMRTRDPAIVRELKRLMATLAPLLDQYPRAPYVLDDVLTYNIVALHALIMKPAGEPAESDNWRARMQARIRDVWGSVSYADNLTHVYAGAASTCLYYHLLTGDASALVQFGQMRLLFLNESVRVNGAQAWDHRMPLNGDVAGSRVGWSLGWQSVEYARYTLQFLLMCNLLGYPLLITQQLAATVARCIHFISPSGEWMLADDVTGTGIYPQQSTWYIGLYGALAKWDMTGKIAALSAFQYKASDKAIFIPICQIYAG